MDNLKHLTMLAESDFDGACVWAENNIHSLNDFFETWARHCGASKQVFIGHTVRMLININKCDHDWEYVADSFDHEFGSQDISVWTCSICGEENTEMEAPEHNYDPTDVI